jgi:sugar phosphate isomerase/epimerase
MHNAAGMLDDVSKRRRQQGVALALENMLPHLFSGHVRDLLWILGALETTKVGVCLDTGHAHLAGDLRTVAHKLLGHLWMVHASDNRGSYDDHLPPGDGQINWERFLKQLDGSGFGGMFVPEITENGGFGETLKGARRARRHLRDISRRMGLTL